MIVMGMIRRLMIEQRAATALEYGIVGGAIALVLGLIFLRIGPHLAEIVAGIAQNLRGVKAAG